MVATVRGRRAVENRRSTTWRRMTQLIGGIAAVAAAVTWSPAWRLAAQRVTPPPPAPLATTSGNGPVRTVPPGTRVAGDPAKKGETYYWLESQTTRLTTRFADATVVAER